MTLATLARRLRRAPVATETLIAYARVRRRMAHQPDLRKLLAAARRIHSDHNGTVPVTEARQLAHAVSRTLTLLPSDPRCLARSLVLIELLARRGVATTLVIGTSAPRAGTAGADLDFNAHAWVELEGEPLMPPGAFAGGRLAEL